MARFLLKQATVEAMRFDGTNGEALYAWAYPGEPDVGDQSVTPGKGGAAHYREAGSYKKMQAGDWLVRSPSGRLARYQAETFAATFEPADSDGLKMMTKG